jgi:hypothetical protein
LCLSFLTHGNWVSISCGGDVGYFLVKWKSDEANIWEILKQDVKLSCYGFSTLLFRKKKKTFACCFKLWPCNKFPQNLVAWNNDNICFAHNYTNWAGLFGDRLLLHLGWLEGWYLKWSKGVLIPKSGGW